MITIWPLKHTRPFTWNDVKRNDTKRPSAVFYLMAVILICVYVACQPMLMSFEQAQQIISGDESRAAAYFISFIIMLLCALTPLPAELIALANTAIYSPTEAFLVTWMSATVSAMAGYELGRLNGYDLCKDKQSNRICRFLNAYGYMALAIMRLIPAVPFFILNIGSGVLQLNRYKYSLITSVTIIPAITVLSFLPQLFL